MAIRKIISRSIGVDVIAAEDLAAGSVETAEIQNGAVTGPKLSDNLNYDSGTLYLDSTNNRVGIGTTSPDSLLELYKAGTSELMIGSDNAGTAQLSFYEGTSGTKEGFLKYDGANNNVVLGTSGAANAVVVARDAGNVGIGTSSPDAPLHVEATNASMLLSNSGRTQYWRIQNNESSDALVFNANDSAERMRIDSSGKVGIGTVSPSTKLSIQNDSSTAYNPASASFNTVLSLKNNTSGASNNALINFATESNGEWYIGGVQNSANNASDFVFASRASGARSERMRIDSSGTLLLNKPTAAAAGDGFFVQADGTFAFTRSVTTTGPLGYLYNEGATASGFRFLSFRLGSFAEVGTITTNGSSTVSYNTSSDYRLKENVEYDFDASTRLKQLKPARFNFIADADTTVDGFLAHEVQGIIPEAISGTKDAVENIGTITDQDNNVIEENITEPSELPEGQNWTQTGTQPVYQGIDQSKLVPILVKSLQEALTEIDSLKARLDDAGL